MKIDKKFKDQIIPLSSEEMSTLESNLIKDGCRDALVVWKEEDILLDGHNRYEICKRKNIEFKIKEISLPNREAAEDWIDSNQLGRRNLTPEAISLLRGRRYNRTKTVGHGSISAGHFDPQKRTSEKLSKEYGVSEKTIRRDGAFAKEVEASPRLLEAIKAKVRIRKVKDQIQQEQRTTERSKAAEKIETSSKEIIIGDFRKHADKIPNGSLSLIFTDPPYDREASKMLPELGKFASDKLANGGSLMLYVGGTQVLAALDAIRPHLRYWWMVACVHAGGKTIMREYGIKCGWKSVLWFVKGTRDDKQTIVDDVMSGGQEKTHHIWQQAESEASYWIEKLCPNDGFVCDPFLGSGTTAVAAKKLGRKWIGIEINEDTAKLASKRIEES
jgi:hypothetical protein